MKKNSVLCWFQIFNFVKFDIKYQTLQARKICDKIGETNQKWEMIVMKITPLYLEY